MNKSDIKLIQRSLKETVASGITVDGVAGNQTSDALKVYCTTFGLKTVEEAYTLLLRYAHQRFVSDDAFAEAAALLGVKESYVRAIAEVESAGASFLPDGRVKILFERHWFYKKLKEAMDHNSLVREHIAVKFKLPTITDSKTIFDLVVKNYSGICNPVRGGYLGNAAEWPRLETAMNLDVEAACQSASYGGYQIMGFNCIACGYKTAAAMAVGFAQSESAQFLGLVKFIKANPKIHTALKAGNWAGVAEGYNGAAYAEAGYHIKLAAAEAKWAKASQ